MAKKTRKVPDVNTSSTADIAFLLLIFFLVTSSMDTDSGLARRLPPPPQDEEHLSEMKVQRRNLMVVLVNHLDQTMAGDHTYNNLEELQGETGGKRSLKDQVKEFIINPNNSEDLPELYEEEFPAPVGRLRVTKDHVISLQNDNTTSYKAYIAVQNELVKAYMELREEAARRYFNKPYEELLTAEKELINEVYPQRISEAEPKSYGGKN